MEKRDRLVECHMITYYYKDLNTGYKVVYYLTLFI